MSDLSGIGVFDDVPVYEAGHGAFLVPPSGKGRMAGTGEAHSDQEECQ
jgi:hypothetical protein